MPCPHGLELGRPGFSVEGGVVWGGKRLCQVCSGYREDIEIYGEKRDLRDKGWIKGFTVQWEVASGRNVVDTMIKKKICGTWTGACRGSD